MRKSSAFIRHHARAGKFQGASQIGLLGLVLAFGVLAAFGFSKLPSIGIDSDSPLLTHVASRYFERSALETGQSHPTLAVFGDYRSLDLAILSLLWFAASLGFFLVESGKKRLLSSSAFLCLVGPVLVWGLGLLGLAGGSNFLDYETLPFPFAPSQIRLAGEFLAILGILLAAGFFIRVFFMREAER